MCDILLLTQVCVRASCLAESLCGHTVQTDKAETTDWEKTMGGLNLPTCPSYWHLLLGRALCEIKALLGQCPIMGKSKSLLLS